MQVPVSAAPLAGPTWAGTVPSTRSRRGHLMDADDAGVEGADGGWLR